MENTLIIDIETWPEQEDILERFANVGTLPERQDFDPSSVKLGNLKDEAKIAAKIEAARISHEEQQDILCDPERAKEDAMEKVREKCCLKGHLCRIYGWGAKDDGFTKEIVQVPDPTRDQERTLVKDLLEILAEHLGSDTRGSKVAGWNTEGFDLPVIFQRAMILGIKIPFRVTTPLFYNEWSLDLAQQWSFATGGRSSGHYVSLNDAAKALGLEPKIHLDGKLPWEMCVESPQRAKEYLERDIDLTYDVGCRMMGVLS